MRNALDEAVRLRELGFAVHWVQRNSKAPVAAGWTKAPVMTVQELRSTYRPGYNVGFRAGSSSVIQDKEICVLDIDIRGGAAYADEAYAAAAAMLGGELAATVISGSGVGRHKYLGFPIGKSPAKAATTLRHSDVWLDRDGKPHRPQTPDTKPAWLIELLSTGKQVLLPPSIHPDTQQPYQWEST